MKEESKTNKTNKQNWKEAGLTCAKYVGHYVAVSVLSELAGRVVSKAFKPNLQNVTDINRGRVING